MKRYARFLLILFVLTACRSPMSHPELADPIYLDLSNIEKRTNGELKSKEKEIETLKKKMAEFGPRDVMRRSTARELSKAEQDFVYLKQKAKYFSVRREQRLEYVKAEYPKRFETERPWPDLEEYESYKKVKELQESSRNWQDRVPKTTKYNRQAK